ncbi:hypothetical protein BGZ70_002031 [Mortierella alpina]|uniref:Uncharacterized protein n=1 Tax=Mortierella alpina TaxID=64518 RepID=A0A9P6LXJ9_MORAP|nr:hypothetical protein BGZ70_002031 [Mortierella alpina]
MTDSHTQKADAQSQLQQPATTKSVASEAEIVPEDATTTPKPEAEPALEPDHDDEPVLETEEVMYVTSTLGSDPTLASTAVAPEPADTSAEPKQSRLSMAFKRISCGLCFHPLKNNGATDYHALVVTPTEEEAPILGQEYDYHHSSDFEGGSGPVVISDDFKGEHYFTTEGASSSSNHHHEGSALHKESKTVQYGQQGVTSTVFEETITVDGPAAEESSQQSNSTTADQELVSERSIPEAATAAASEGIEKQTTPAVAIPTTSAKVVLDTPLASPSGTPSTTRSKTFAKLKRRSNTSSPAASSIPSSPTSSSNNSPLLERLGRFAKLMRSNETSSSTTTTTTSTSNSSIQTKVVESLQVSQAPEKQVTVTSFTSTPVAASTADIKDTAADTPVDQQETMATSTSDTPTEQDVSSSVPPLPRHARRGSLALDTQVFKSQPVAIPGQSQEGSTPLSAPLSATLVQNHIWTHSESPTLHQQDASTSSGRSLTLLTRIGRASTMDSAQTIEGNSSEAGSLGSSGKDGSFLKEGKDSKDDKKQRRKSVLKKLGKMINGDRKKEKAEKRLSQQGSMTMQSPIEAEENFGVLKT